VSIAGQDFYRSKELAFGAAGSTGIFPSAYITCVNSALKLLASDLNLTAMPTGIEKAGQDIDFTDDYAPALEAAVDMLLLKTGNFHRGDLTVAQAEAVYQSAVASARTWRDQEAARNADTEGDTWAYFDD